MKMKPGCCLNRHKKTPTREFNSGRGSRTAAQVLRASAAVRLCGAEARFGPQSHKYSSAVFSARGKIRGRLIENAESFRYIEETPLGDEASGAKARSDATLRTINPKPNEEMT